MILLECSDFTCRRFEQLSKFRIKSAPAFGLHDHIAEKTVWQARKPARHIQVRSGECRLKTRYTASVDFLTYTKVIDQTSG
jgi:hypothetical protein